ncbi:hypothetical protein RP20_CCG016107 [Aedes albopictus]|nr:hypothetical protein RP20_CCG016107 [Aedes albopictus]
MWSYPRRKHQKHITRGRTTIHPQKYDDRQQEDQATTFRCGQGLHSTVFDHGDQHRIRKRFKSAGRTGVSRQDLLASRSTCLRLPGSANPSYVL